MNRKQEIQAENAISEIKTQIESDSKKLYDEMKEQVNFNKQTADTKQNI